MAKPFELKRDEEKKKDKQGKSSEKVKGIKHSHHNEEAIHKVSARFCGEDFNNGPRSGVIPRNIHHISNSKSFNSSPTVINVVDIRNVMSYPNITKMESSEQSRRIRVRKGIFDSKRIISAEDIKIVSEDVGEDWNQLLKKLSGVTFNNSSYHQTFINAMDEKEFSNLAETALSTWKCVLPEFSTIGNLSKALFSIDHPDIVTHLRP